MKKSTVLSVAFSVLVLVAANVRADFDMVDYDPVTYEGNIWKANGGGDISSFLNATATMNEAGTGVVFSFIQAEGATAKVKDGEFYLYNVENIFDASEGIFTTAGLKTGGNPTGVGGSGWGNPNWTATVTPKTGNGFYAQDEATFTLYFSENGNWDSFAAWLEESTFAIGFHELAMNNGQSAVMVVNDWKLPEDPSTAPTATPEPATLAIIGLGLAGLGFARRRMAK